MSELSSIFQTDKKISIGDREITIKTISIGDIPKVIGIVAFFDSNKSVKDSAIELMTNHFSLVVELFKCTTSLKEDEINSLNPAAAIHIFNNIVMENSDFLVKHVIPQVQAMTKSMDGLKQSKS